MRYLVSMTPTEVAHLTIENFQLDFTAKIPVVAHLKSLVAVTPMTLLKN
jgi:hypothetical protein